MTVNMSNFSSPLPEEMEYPDYHIGLELELLEMDREAARVRSSTWPLRDPALLDMGEGEQRFEQRNPTLEVKEETPECESPTPQSKTDPKHAKMRNAWGNMSYAELITQAILSSPEKRLTLSEIYEWIVKNVSYFTDKANSPSTAGWKVCCMSTAGLSDQKYLNVMYIISLIFKGVKT